MKLQKGFTTLEIVLLVLFVAVAVFGGYEAYQNHHKSDQPAVTPSPNPTITATPLGSAAAVPRCRTADLSLSIGNSNGAAGTAYTALIFTNKSGHTCTLLGYPGLTSVSASGSQIGQPAERSNAASPALVTLAAGESAHATFGHASDTSASNPSCPTQSASLKVYPPDETGSLSIAFQGCPVSTVYPVASGTSPTIQ